MHKLIQARIHALPTEDDAHTHKSPARYIHDYDCRVGNTPTITREKYLFLAKQSPRTTLEITADAIAKKKYRKLQLPTTRPFRIVSIRSNTYTSPNRQSSTSRKWKYIRDTSR